MTHGRSTARVAISTLLVAYLVVGYASFFGDQVYPIFSWSLFTFIPHEEAEDYAVRILSIDDRAFSGQVLGEEPIVVARDVPRVVSRRMSIRLGEAVTSADGARTDAALTTLLDRHFVLPDSARLVLVHRRYDRIKRWSRGEFISTSVVDTLLYRRE